MPLTDLAIVHARPRDKPWKLSDARGLYLLVNPSGSKLWYLKYRFAGKEKKLALGGYPKVAGHILRQQGIVYPCGGQIRNLP